MKRKNRKFNDFGYGIMSNTDVKAIEESLEILVSTFGTQEPLKLLEIGTFDGSTMRGIKGKMDQLGATGEYWSVDNGLYMKEKKPAFEGCHLVIGESTECFMDIPNDFHWVFIDGCHCSNHVMLDFLNYGSKVVKNGIVLFHDISPNAQGRGWQNHGPRGTLAFETAVLDAFKKLDIMNSKSWENMYQKYDPTCKWGGIGAFRRTV